ncbi:MAG: DEAD/DEAH box helicase [Lentisphaeria bacterium]|jgi:superfamily II DNA or RNA helicase
MNFSRLSYPPSPPPWLAQWPAEADINALFSSGIQRASLSSLNREDNADFHWDERQLRMRLGNQSTTWTLADGQWRQRCSCGYISPTCIHAFAAHVLLKIICRREQWPLPGPEAAGGKAPAGDSQATPTRLGGSAQRPRQESFSNFFQDQQPRSGRPCELEVEADFQHEPGKVGIRFYAKEDGMRQLLSLNALRNAGFQLTQNKQPSRLWPDKDQQFLRWLFPLLKKLRFNDLNLKMHKLSEQEFRSWLSRWQNTPGRFIDRSNQEFIKSGGFSAPVDFSIELHDQGEWVLIEALFHLSDGRRLRYHELLKEFPADNPAASITRRQIFSSQPPVPWVILNEYFAKKSPRMRREGVCTHLKELINNRLDIVSGPGISREEGVAEDIRVSARQEGDAFVISATLAGAALSPDASQALPSAIIERQGRFVICSSGGTVVQALRQSLHELAARGSVSNDAVLLPATGENAMALRDFWRQLPASVGKLNSAPLRQLLGDKDAELLPMLEMRDQRAFVSVDIVFAVGGSRISAAELTRISRSQQPAFRISSGEWLAIDPQKAAALLVACRQDDFADFQGTMLRHDAQAKLQQLVKDPRFNVAPASRSFYEQLCCEVIPEAPPLPPELAAILRAYQRDGVRFLADRCLCGAGAILADDMGLGKTLQIIALLSAWQRRAKARSKSFTALVVCPASVIGVWLQQSQQFSPDLPVQALRGNRHHREAILAENDNGVLVTNYGLLRQDIDLLAAKPFDFVILDEAQNIKNPAAQVTQAVKSLQAKQRLALTGTPLENQLSDLWSIMDFLNPGFFGDLDHFNDAYNGGSDALARLSRRLAPVMLRRTKEQVATELPPRIEEVLRVEMHPEQLELYNRALLFAREKLHEHGAAHVLASLTRLRQICCHAELMRKAPSETPSAKLDLLLEHLQELHGSGHSALVFSQFTSMLDIIARELDKLAMPYYVITGETPVEQRAKRVEDFSSSPEPAVFLLSLKAAGTGLTLTKADYVFLYDPWWNPAVERQAIDRTHRIGQDKTVIAYKLIAQDSVEEKVLALVEKKRELFNAVMDGAQEQAAISRLSLAELKELLR